METVNRLMYRLPTKGYAPQKVWGARQIFQYYSFVIFSFRRGVYCSHLRREQ